MTLLSVSSFISAQSQFVARMEVKEPIDGLCDQNEVYALFPSMTGQEEAVCPIDEKLILERLNNDVTFLKENPKYDDKGMIGLIISCRGELVQCKMDNKTKKPELDAEIEKVFKSLGQWTAGKLNGKKVDTSKLFSFKIKNGKFSFD